MKTDEFSKSASDWCRTSKVRPDQQSLNYIIKRAKKKPIEKGNAIIIGRYNWLSRNKLLIPNDMNLPNLCVIIKKGELRRAFYSNTMTDIIKKQSYYIQIIN